MFFEVSRIRNHRPATARLIRQQKGACIFIQITSHDGLLLLAISLILIAFSCAKMTDGKLTGVSRVNRVSR